jgi:hypothetical protein
MAVQQKLSELAATPFNYSIAEDGKAEKLGRKRQI